VAVASRERQPNDLLREARGQVSQATLAELVNAEIYQATGRIAAVTSKSISDWECGWYSWPAADVRSALCKALGVSDPAELGFQQRRRTSPERSVLAAGRAATPLLELVGAGREMVEEDVAEALSVPGGRSFVGVEFAARHCVAEGTGREWLAAEPSEDSVGSLSRPDRRSLLIAADPRGDGPRYYVYDGRRFAGRAVRSTGPQLVPAAHLLDDLTVGIIWAIANTDLALLEDDAQLERYQARLAHYEGRATSAATLSEVPDLNTVSRQWLGSRFCSRHIMRHWERLGAAPLFWTREQRGEEAASWLIWSHKFEYLRSTARRFDGARRGFCIPAHEVSASPRYERVLLLLAMALMEAFGIRVELSTEPQLAEIEGFVLADDVIVANWLRAPGLWYVDAGAPLSSWSTYREIDRHLDAESTVAQPTPAGRLKALASHLNIPWGWFRTRCEELALIGVDGIAHPRSRLLSTNGLNTAIRYVAYLDRT
jgi:hypothetical protein